MTAAYPIPDSASPCSSISHKDILPLREGISGMASLPPKEHPDRSAFSFGNDDSEVKLGVGLAPGQASALLWQRGVLLEVDVKLRKERNLR